MFLHFLAENMLLLSSSWTKLIVLDQHEWNLVMAMGTVRFSELCWSCLISLMDSKHRTKLRLVALVLQLDMEVHSVVLASGLKPTFPSMMSCTHREVIFSYVGSLKGWGRNMCLNICYRTGIDGHKSNWYPRSSFTPTWTYWPENWVPKSEWGGKELKVPAVRRHWMNWIAFYLFTTL